MKHMPIFIRSLCIVALFGSLTVDGFFFDKLERFKKFTFPNYSSSLGGLMSPNTSNGVRVCINFSSNYPQGYQQNTCFLCDGYRFTQIATYCTGQSSIPSNINYTQANCIMNNCQPMYPSQRYPTTSFVPFS